MTDDITSPENVSNLIEAIKKTKDPSIVGLRRILKKKENQGKDFPLKSQELKELGQSQLGSKEEVFDETEKRVLELEKEVIDLKRIIEKNTKESVISVDQSYKKGLTEGFANGEEKGYTKAKSEYDQQLELFKSKLTILLKDIEKSKKKLILNAEEIILDLTLLMTRKVINAEVAMNPKIILSVIKKTISYIVDNQDLIVRVAPDDLETVIKKQDFWSSIAKRLDNVSIEKDQRIKPGGCIIESSSGIADSRIDVQINELEELIKTNWQNLVENDPDESPSPPITQEEPQAAPENSTESLDSQANINK